MDVDELMRRLDGAQLRIAADRATAQRRRTNPQAPSVTKRELVEQALADVDTGTIEAEVDSRWRWEEWDRESPINGMPAQQMLRRRRNEIPPGARIFLLLEEQEDGTERVVMFQPHRPGVGGMQPIDDPETDVEPLRQRAVADRVQGRVAQAVIDRLNGG